MSSYCGGWVWANPLIGACNKAWICWSNWNHLPKVWKPRKLFQNYQQVSFLEATLLIFVFFFQGTKIVYTKKYSQRRTNIRHHSFENIIVHTSILGFKIDRTPNGKGDSFLQIIVWRVPFFWFSGAKKYSLNFKNDPETAWDIHFLRRKPMSFCMI